MNVKIEILKLLKYAVEIFIWSIIWSIPFNAITASIPILQLRKKKRVPSKYIIKAANRIDYQQENECAAFATAYVLRHFNIDEEGNELYKRFPCESPFGGVMPRGIRIVLRKYGLKTKYQKGNIDSLKEDLNNGVPIIVFVRSSPDSRRRHFVPVTGYDETGFYLAESVERLSSIAKEHGVCNRKVNYKDFKKMWNMQNIFMLFYSNTYIVASSSESKI